MALQLILGSSGAGKSYMLYQKIIADSIEHPDQRYIILVPEQFSMETQKDIVKMHPRHGTVNIDVLSFGRLAYYTFEEVGEKELPVLDDTGKNLILRKVLEAEKDKLKLYGSKLRMPGFVSEIKSVLSEFYQYGIHEQKLDEILKDVKKRPMLEAKLSDMRRICHAFEAYIEERFITKEEILDAFCGVVERSKRIRKSIICLDGFTGFTPIQYKLLAHLMALSKELYITVTIDRRENPDQIKGEQELFYLSKQTIAHLDKIAREHRVERRKDIRIDDRVPYRFRGQKALEALEASLFRYPYHPWREKPDGISLYEARTPMDEADYVARTIWKLIREEGYRYQDIAVITGDMERYGDNIEEIFQKHNIPCFLDRKTNIMGNPFVEFIRGSIGIMAENYSYESVFRYLRSGLVDLEREDIDYLENYCIALGIRGRKRWNSLWVRNVKKGVPLDLDYVNTLRKKVTDSIEPLWENWTAKGADVKSRMIALHEFIRSHYIQEKLTDYVQNFEEKKELSLAKEYKQTYRLIMELFDKVVGLLGEEKMSRKELCDILDAGFEEIKVGLIPPTMDQVIVGDMERTRLKDIRALFFIGVNDGIIPKSESKGGLITELEREFLQKKDVTLAPTSRQNAYIQKFYLYLNLTKPRERLYLSYSDISQDGNTLRPSYLIGTMKKLFPLLKETRQEEPLSHLTTPEGTLHYWIEGLEKAVGRKNKEDVIWCELFSWYLKSPDWNGRMKTLRKAACFRNHETGISKIVAASLYGPQSVNSVTRLEQYAACAFAHFLAYGLKLKPRQEFEIAALDIGNMFHAAIERYSRKLKQESLSYTQVKETKRKELVHACVQEISTDYGNQVLEGSARNSYLIERLERITDRTVWALTEQLKRGSFEPVNYEVAFSEADDLKALTISLEDGEDMKLKGRIDRMDVYEDEEHIYVKILDYKSGGTTFDLSSAYYGLQMQLIVYMDAAIEAEKRKNPEKIVIPAGIFYYNIKDPVIEKEEDMKKETIDERLLSELRMNGLMSGEDAVIDLMDEQAKEEGKSIVVPVTYNKNGGLSKTSSTISAEQFQRLIAHVRKQLKKMGTEILNGNTQIAPYEKGNKDACKYCEYRFVCGFDPQIAGYQKRRLKELKTEEIWERIEEELDQ